MREDIDRPTGVHCGLGKHTVNVPKGGRICFMKVIPPSRFCHDCPSRMLTLWHRAVTIYSDAVLCVLYAAGQSNHGAPILEIIQFLTEDAIRPLPDGSRSDGVEHRRAFCRNLPMQPHSQILEQGNIRPLPERFGILQSNRQHESRDRCGCPSLAVANCVEAPAANWGETRSFGDIFARRFVRLSSGTCN